MNRLTAYVELLTYRGIGLKGLLQFNQFCFADTGHDGTPWMMLFFDLFYCFFALF
jgi:hypothetical protein